MHDLRNRDDISVLNCGLVDGTLEKCGFDRREIWYQYEEIKLLDDSRQIIIKSVVLLEDSRRSITHRIVRKRLEMDV